MVSGLVRVRVEWLALLLMMTVIGSYRRTDAQTSPPPGAAAIGAAARSAFESMKGLAGEWDGRVTTDPPNADVEGTIHISMRVASRGNLLIHEIASGDQPEATAVFLDNDRLTLVHYCDAGNRPRLVARRSSNPKTLAFEFVDSAGPAEPAVLQHLELTLLDAAHHLEDWTFKLAGDQRLRAHFNLTRSKNIP